MTVPGRSAVADLEDQLARRRAQLCDLEAELAILADPGEVAIDDEHDSEGSTIGFERARVAGLLARTRQAVTGLEGALERATSGTYGWCVTCGSAIGEERLAALPAARECVGCATAGEAASPVDGSVAGTGRAGAGTGRSGHRGPGRIGPPAG